MIEIKFNQMVSGLTTEDEVNRYAQEGHCRLWVLHAAETLMREFGITKNEIEFREVEVSPMFFHTFLKVSIGEDNYFLDGAGVNGSGSYFGLECEAPVYLQNSRQDSLNFYI